MTDWRIESKAVHAGESIDPHSGASAPNIVMSSSFATDKPSGFSINAFEGEVPYVYTRWGNPTIAMLEGKLAAMEGAEACVAFASGMAATTALLLTALRSGDHVVISDVNYPGTAEFVREILPRYGMSSTAVDTSKVENIVNAIRGTTRLIWIETPANPILRLSDIAAVAEVAKAHHIPLAVDSTFATPVVTQPLALGADYVIHSLTKYIGGHGDALGGAVLGSNDNLEKIRTEALIHLGGVISPFNAWLISRGAATLPARMHAHQSGAAVVARFLEDHPLVLQVNYPGLPSHPQHELASRQMTGYSGMLSFQVKQGASVAERVAKELKLIHYAVSLGHCRSLIYWISTDEILSTAYQLDEEQSTAYRSYAGDGVFRLSVGMENPLDLCEDLSRVLGN